MATLQGAKTCLGAALFAASLTVARRAFFYHFARIVEVRSD
jgi:hypothetical protein